MSPTGNSSSQTPSQAYDDHDFKEGGPLANFHDHYRVIKNVAEQPVTTPASGSTFALSESQKETIFDHKLRGYRDRDIETQAVLERLRRFSPETAACFASKAARTDGFAFRLFCQNGTPFSALRPSYIALSYRWQVSETGPSLPVSSLLWTAVLQELQSYDEGLWVDQMCIDQSDMEEKALSIGMMDMIYEQAGAVIVPLGDVLLSAQDLTFLASRPVDYLATLNMHATGRPDDHDPDPETLLRQPEFRQMVGLAARLAASEYFSRAWCTHEFRLGRECVVLIPCEEPRTLLRKNSMLLFLLMQEVSLLIIFNPKLQGYIPGALKDSFYNILGTLTTSIRNSPSGAEEEHQTPSAQFWTLGELRQIEAFGAGGDVDSPLGSRQRLRTAYRDKMAITLNSLKSNVVVLPEPYKQLDGGSKQPAAEHLRKALLISLARKEYLALCCPGPLLPRESHDSYSWLRGPDMPMDWVSKKHAVLDLEPDLSLCPDDVDKYVELPVHLLKGRAPSERSIGVARNLVQSMYRIFLAWGTELPWLTVHGRFGWQRRVQSFEPILSMTLACILELGTRWARDFLSLRVKNRRNFEQLGISLSSLEDPQPFSCAGDTVPFGLSEIHKLACFRDTEPSSIQESETLTREGFTSALLKDWMTLASETDNMIRENKCFPARWWYFRAADALLACADEIWGVEEKPTMPGFFSPFLISVGDVPTPIYIAFRPVVESSVPTEILLDVPSQLTSDMLHERRRLWTVGCAAIDGETQLSLFEKSCIYGPPLADLGTPLRLRIFGPPKRVSQLRAASIRRDFGSFWQPAFPNRFPSDGITIEGLRGSHVPYVEEEVADNPIAAREVASVTYESAMASLDNFAAVEPSGPMQGKPVPEVDSTASQMMQLFVSMAVDAEARYMAQDMESSEGLRQVT